MTDDVREDELMNTHIKKKKSHHRRESVKFISVTLMCKNNQLLHCSGIFVSSTLKFPHLVYGWFWKQFFCVWPQEVYFVARQAWFYCTAADSDSLTQPQHTPAVNVEPNFVLKKTRRRKYHAGKTDSGGHVRCHGTCKTQRLILGTASFVASHS